MIASDCAAVGCPGEHPLAYARQLDHAVLARRAGQATEADVLAEMETVHDRFLREQTIDFMERTIGDE